MTTNLKQEERLDDLQIHGYEIIQHPGRFCFGMDAVLLSNFAAVKKGESALDLGTGTGIIPILLEAKTEGEHFTGLEIQKESADMAQRSVAHNHLEQKITIQTGDIKEAGTIFSPASFDVITTNPPYMLGEHGLKNEADAKTIARHEVLCTLDDILRESAKLLKFKGRFYMVHRPFRLPAKQIQKQQRRQRKQRKKKKRRKQKKRKHRKKRRRKTKRQKRKQKKQRRKKQKRRMPDRVRKG